MLELTLPWEERMENAIKKSIAALLATATDETKGKVLTRGTSLSAELARHPALHVKREGGPSITAQWHQRKPLGGSE